MMPVFIHDAVAQTILYKPRLAQVSTLVGAKLTANLLLDTIQGAVYHL